MAVRHARAILAVVAVGLVAAACADREEPEGVGSQAESPTQTQTDAVPAPVSSEPASPSTLAVLDASIHIAGWHTWDGCDMFPYDCVYDDLRSITCASDVAFIGRITGYVEGLRTSTFTDDRAVYDGLVFTVDELLSAGIDGVGEKIAVAFLALSIDDDRDVRWRHTDGAFPVLRQGIVRRDHPDRPSYLVYARADGEGAGSGSADVLYFHTDGGVAEILDDGSIRQGAARPFAFGHGFDVEDARVAARAAEQLCLEPPLPPGVRALWFNETGLQLTVDEDVWADRLDRVCKTAAGPDLGSPVWDQDAALALAEEFAEADGLRPDLPPEFRREFLVSSARVLWQMIVHRAGPDGPSVCWEAVPEEFLADVPPLGDWVPLPEGYYTVMTDAAYYELSERFFVTRLWQVEPPLPPGTREIWWDLTGLRSTIDEDVWARRLNDACNTPERDPEWDRADAARLAERLVIDEGGEPTAELVEAGASALWRMTAVPPDGACPWHFPSDAFEPEHFEEMREARRAALSP